MIVVVVVEWWRRRNNHAVQFREGRVRAPLSQGDTGLGAGVRSLISGPVFGFHCTRFTEQHEIFLKSRTGIKSIRGKKNTAPSRSSSSPGSWVWPVHENAVFETGNGSWQLGVPRSGVWGRKITLRLEFYMQIGSVHGKVVWSPGFCHPPPSFSFPH